MKKINQILAVLFILLGVFAVLIGMSSTEITTVIGGGLFMALGVATSVLSEK